MHALRHNPLSTIERFLSSEAVGGVVLIAAAALALGVANSPAAPFYFKLLGVRVAGLSVLHWINDALMAAFFLLVGLEIKRELMVGELSSWRKRALPGIGACGGMLVPALIYLAFNAGSPESLRGWAIPSATDIAFSLGLLSLLGSRVPVSLKVFLTALAILDDLGAVAIIAVAYTSELNVPMLSLAAVSLVAAAGLNWWNVNRLWPYLVLGAVLWFFVLKSGVHATLAGVALAAAIPLNSAGGGSEAGEGALLRLEHALAPWVAYLIIPVFGFANAGVAFAGTDMSSLLAPVPLGIALGLFVGKQLGVSVFCWIAVRSRVAELPENATWSQLYGAAVLCGIGFTMSLFIGYLAFPASAELQNATKLGVLAGSGLSAVVGMAVLWSSGSRVNNVVGKA